MTPLFRSSFVAAGAGAAAALGHAPFSLWPVALLGFAFLFWNAARQPSARSAGLVTWVAGAVHFAVSLHWIVEPFFVDAARHGWMAPFAIALMSGGLALFWGLAGWIGWRVGAARALGIAVAIAAAEIVRGHVFTGFPWAMPAYVWTETPVRLTAAFWGPYGLTLLTLVLCAMPSVPLRRTVRVAVVLGLVGALFGMGLLRDTLVSTGEGSATRPLVRLAQPNVPQDQKWDATRAPVFIERLLVSTGASADRRPDLVVWPETAIPYPLDLAGPVLRRAADAADGVPVMTGLNRRTPQGAWFNSLIVLGEEGWVTETYDKVHLVPFGEYIPGRIDLLRRMAAFTGFGFTPGEAVRAIDTPLGRAVPLICYEAIFPGHIRLAGERPELLIQLTNDAWFGTFAGPFQHLEQARFRAAEQGLPLIRAANTGVSAVIGPTGEVVASLGLGKEGHIDAEMPIGLSPTLYSRTGDLPIMVLLVALLGGLFIGVRRNPIAKGP